VAPECFWSFSLHAQDVRCTVKRDKPDVARAIDNFQQGAGRTPPATMGSVTELWLAVDICEWGCIQCWEGKYFEVKTGNELEKGEYETI